MHRALEVVAAVDINTIANDVYQENYPETSVWNRNIQSIRQEEIDCLGVNTILMSPPCQPFTRVEVRNTFERLSKLPPEGEEYKKLLESLEMRFFTPNEVAELMGFKGGIKWPDNVSNRQKYKLLGNSLNVSVVQVLINLLAM
uniref:tRNA (cytosine(38)-C(5))-methyltransferase n=1 Tax=Lutzomyia longipalpis TaxID=7200 RepID=A0A1B0CC08_LUTLO